VTGHLGDAVGNEVDDIDPRHALLLEQEYCLAFLLAEDRHEHVGASDFTLARALHMEHRALQDALKSKRRLGFTIFLMHRNKRCCGVNELLQIAAQFIQIRSAGTQHIGGRLVVEQSQQQMLDRHEFVAFGPGVLEGQIEGDF